MAGKNSQPEFRKLIVDIKVRDLKRAADFYENILGLTVIDVGSGWASLKALGAEIHLYLHGGAENGLEFRVAEIEKQVKTLKSRGVKFFIEPNQIGLIKISGEIMEFSWGKAAYFKDSEGNRLALVEDK